MRLFLVLCIFCLSAAPAWAAQQKLTLYLDGALVEQEIASAGNVLEFPVPAAMQPGSLRIRPLGRTVIDRVEVTPAGKGKKRENEAARLAERRGQLNDRLKALETREDIFRAAAKSQSGKAPRKTKTNPEPLAAIRQGTEFAFAQLEEVYRSRRKTEKELKEVEAKLAAQKNQEAAGSVARIWLAGNGKVRASYIRSDLKWLPSYDFRLDGSGSADVALRAVLPQLPKGAAVFVAPSILADGAAAKPLPVRPGSRPAVTSFRLTAAKELFTPGPRSSISFTLTNAAGRQLPEGSASCYWKGEYIGTAAFPGCRPGDSREIAAGGR